jgi:sucrose-6-phosphate hydrolase SacC (GH32 family)
MKNNLPLSRLMEASVIMLVASMFMTACGGGGGTTTAGTPNQPVPQPQPQPDPNPTEAGLEAIAYWPLDDNKGALAREAVSGRGDPVHYVFNHARFKPNSDPLWRTAAQCIKGGCLLFDGYSTDIAAPGLTAAQIKHGLTLSAWVAPHAFEWGDGDNYSAVLSQFDEGLSQGFSFGIHRHGNWGIKLGFGSSVIDLRVRDQKLARDHWSHIAATYDPVSRTVRLFLNGIQVASKAGPAQGDLIVPMRELTVGRHSQPLSVAGVFQFNTFFGLMDEVRVGTGAANAAQLAKLVAADLQAHGGTVPTLSSDDVKMPLATFDGDRYRPQYHAMPDSGWMNEPHAPLYYNGQYHLFFQKNPFGPFWHQIHWGHWTSPDMVHWREQAMALVTEDDALAPDGIWSGSAILKADGTPALFFTAGNDSLRPNQRTALATPKDLSDPLLLDWVKYPTPVTVQQSGPNFTGDFRDPFVFRDEAGKRWFQLVGSRTPGGSGIAMIHESTDLINWTYRGPLFTIDAKKYPGFENTFELPVMLPIGKGIDGRERYVFLCDIGAQAYYWTGVFDPNTARFTLDSEAPRVFDVGQGHFSGPSGFKDPKTGRVILHSIAQGERTAQMDWDAGWAHNAGLPIEMKIGPDGDVRINPIDELKTLRQAALVNLAGVSVQEAKAALAKVSGDVLEIELELQPAAGVEAKRGLVVRLAPDGSEQTAVYADSAPGRFEIDRTRTTLDPDMRSNGIQGGAFTLGKENLRLRLFLDRSMVEAYVNERKSLTSRVFPARLDSLGLGLLAAPGDRVVSLKVWPLNALNGKPPAPVQPSGIKIDPVTAFASGLPNGGFASCDLSGWTIKEGSAFANSGVTRQTTLNGTDFYGNNRAPGACHFAGFLVPGGDAPTGVMESEHFVLGGDGQINFLISGGGDSERLYLALVRASDGKELMKTSGLNFEQYQRTYWDASTLIGETLYLKAVDRASGGWGHLNLDSINVPVGRLVK